MTSPTQTIVSKSKPNSLIAENLLKNLWELIPPILAKFFTTSLTWNGKSTKNCTHFSNEMNYRSNLSC